MFESSTANLLLLAQAANDGSGEIEKTPFYETGPFMFVCILALLFISWFTAKAVAKKLRMQEYSGRLFVIMTTILVGVLLVTAKFPPKFGVDLKGGMNLIGSLNMEEFENLDPG